MRSDSELLMLIFRSVKGWAWLLCCSILQNPTEHKLIREPDGPRRQILAQNPTTRPIRLSNKKMASVFNQEKNLTEQSRPGTTAVRGTHKSTSSDRCVGLRIQPRYANAVAAPRRSQTTASCRSTRARTHQVENKKSSAPSACLSWLRIIREYTQSSRSSCWSRMLR